jgi:hypothetical protein
MHTTDHAPTTTTRTAGDTMTDRTAAIQANLKLYQALLKAKRELPVITKTKTANIQHNGGGSHRYSYADLADIDREATPVLADNGLMVDFEMHKGDDGAMVLTGMLIHPESGGYKVSEWDVTGRSPQDQGSSITYGRRYLTGILTGIITDDDTDGQQVNPGARPAAKRPARPVNPATPQQIQQLGQANQAGIDLGGIMLSVIGRKATPGDISEDEATKVLDAANASVQS